MFGGWFQRVKDKEFESNSQQEMEKRRKQAGWFQRVKDKEFESNSQPVACVPRLFRAGFSVSKIKNLKAIHNIM